MLEEKTVVEQKRTQSRTWWVGMIACMAQGVCAVAVAAGIMPPGISAAVTGAFAAVLAYCNGNNPSIKGEY